VLDPAVLSRPGTVLLDTGRPGSDHARSFCFVGPVRTLVADTASEVPEVLEEIDRSTDAGAFAAGYLSYEAGYPFVDLEAPDLASTAPVAWFGIYDHPVILAPSEVDRGLEGLESGAPITDAHLSVSEAEYIEAIERIQGHIGRGDVYQINYTAPVRFEAPGDPRVLYRRLRGRQRVPYGAYLHLGDRHILSCSPELFFRREGRRIVTRPMKGTTRRGRTLAEDRRLQEALASDPKNRAENLMIVDLLRNDLSVTCQTGSVEVPDLYSTEPYDTVTQMTSTVQGQLRSDAGLPDVMRALFPCGSVTGAPKRRAMRLIRDFEQERRGIYCGAIGMAGPNDSAAFSVAIRTVVLEEERGTMGVGSGIVWDSDPASEYEECDLKTAFLSTDGGSRQGSSDASDFRLIETMRFDGVQIPLLDRHVGRLAGSAKYFNFPFSESRLRERLRAVLSGSYMDTTAKVRVTLDRWGRIDVETTTLSPSGEDPWKLVVADERADNEDPYFFHKTTNRTVYERALEQARAEDADEALLLNQDGHVTEGTYSSVFVRRGETLLTPPVSEGLLAGVYRQYVLDTQERAEQQILTMDDLRAADAIYCCNAVRGWRDAEFVSSTVATET